MINVNDGPEQEEEEQQAPSSNSKGTLKTAHRNPMSPDSSPESKVNMKTDRQ
jgi:hypothetical protein